jgi:hypothetical protein
MTVLVKATSNLAERMSGLLRAVRVKLPGRKIWVMGPAGPKAKNEGQDSEEEAGHTRTVSQELGVRYRR